MSRQLNRTIFYKSFVRHDLKKIDPKNLMRILREIGTGLGNNPHAGKPLHGEFKGLYKLRFGDYWVIYTLIREGVLVLRIGGRSKAYE
jgi:mRNA interferase RelE/StbE